MVMVMAFRAALFFHYFFSFHHNYCPICVLYDALGYTLHVYWNHSGEDNILNIFPSKPYIVNDVKVRWIKHTYTKLILHQPFVCTFGVLHQKKGVKNNNLKNNSLI